MSHSNNDVSSSSKSQLDLVVRMEGGAIYTSNVDGKFKIIINQVVLFDLLDEDEEKTIEPIKEMEFPSDEERLKYLIKRGWKK